MSEKRYRFRKLKDRVRDTRVNVTHAILADHELEVDRDEDAVNASFFADAFVREQAMERSKEFKDYVRSVSPMVQSLPLILHNLGKIVALTTKQLPKCKSKLAMLRLIALLAKDTQHEFFNYLSPVLAAVLNLIDPDDLDETAAAFRCVGNLLQELSKTIIDKDPEMKLLKPHFTPLIGHRRDFVRRFAAETFAPLMRQLPINLLRKQIRSFICKLASGPGCVSRNHDQQDEIVDGVAQFVFHTMKNVHNTLHSVTSDVLKCTFSTLHKSSTKDTVEEQIEQRTKCIEKTIGYTLDFITRETSAPLWTELLQHLGQGSKFEPRHFAKYIQVVNAAVGHRGRSKFERAYVSSLLSTIVKDVLKCKSSKPVWDRDETITAEERDLAKRSIVDQGTFTLLQLWLFNHVGGQSCDDIIGHVLEASETLMDTRMLCTLVNRSLKTVRDKAQLYDGLLKYIVAQFDTALSGVSSAPMDTPSKKNKKDKKTPSRSKSKSKLESDLAANSLVVTEKMREILSTCAMIGNVMEAAEALSEEMFRLSKETNIMKCCNLILKESSKFLGDSLLRAAIETMWLCKGGSDAFEPTLVDFIVTTAPEDSILASRATTILCAQANWTTSENHRRKLMEYFVVNFQNHKAEAATIGVLVTLLEDNAPKGTIKVLEEQKDDVVANLLSNEHALRLNSLKLLQVLLRDKMFLTAETDAGEEEDQRKPWPVIDLMIQVESLPIDYGSEKIRERLMGSIERPIRYSRAPREHIPLVLSFYLGQFHVAYSPAWASVASGIAQIARVEFNLLWPMYWGEILKASAVSFGRKLTRLAPVKRKNTPHEEDEIAKRSDRSTLPLEHFKQLFAALHSMMKPIQKRVDQLVHLFFTFLRDEYYLSSGRTDDLDMPKPDEDENAYLAKLEAESGKLTVSRESTSLISTQKLVVWLELFGNFNNFVAGEATDTLRKVMERMLVVSEGNIRGLALQVLLKMQLPYLHGYHSQLEALAKDSTFREAITTMNIKRIEDSQRRGLLPVLAKLLFSHVVSKKRKSNKDSLTPEGRRAIVFNFFSGVKDAEEARPIFDLVFRAFPKGVNFEVPADDPRSAIDALDIGSIPFPRIASFVLSVESLIKSLGTLTVEYLDQIMAVVFAVLLHGEAIRVDSNGDALLELEEAVDENSDDDVEASENEDGEEGDASDVDIDAEVHESDSDSGDDNGNEMETDSVEEETKNEDNTRVEIGSSKNTSKRHVFTREEKAAYNFKSIRTEALRKLCTIFAAFDTIDMSKWTQVLGEALEPVIGGISSSVINQHRPPTLLRLTQVFANNDGLAEWGLLQACPRLLPSIVECLSAGVDSGRGAGVPIVLCIYDILQACMKRPRIVDEFILPSMSKLLNVLLMRFSAGASATEAFRRDPKSRASAVKTMALARRQIARRELHILNALAGIFQEFREGKEADEPSQEICCTLINMLTEFLGSTNISAFTSGKSAFAKKSSASKITSGKIALRKDVGARNDGRQSLLETISRLMSLAHSKLDESYVQKFSRFLGIFGIDPMYDVSTRDQLLHIFDILGTAPKLKAHFGQVAELLRNLNSWDRRRVDLFDMDKRLEAYEEICKGKWTSLQLLPFSHQALLDMNEDEYPLRSAAAHMITEAVIKADDPTTMSVVVVPAIMPGIRSGLKSHQLSLRKGFVGLLTAVSTFVAGLKEGQVKRLDNGPVDLEAIRVATFSDMTKLTNTEEPEKDFYISIAHVQAYRQSSYLSYLRKALASGDIQLHSSTILHVLLPITLTLLTTTSKENEAHIKEEGVMMVGQLSSQLAWTHYLNLLRHLLRTAEKKPELEKRMIKAACYVIDNYPFAHGSEDPKLARALRVSILPLFEDRLVGAKKVGSDKKVVRPSVAVAITKVLKLLPNEELEANLPRILKAVTVTCRSLDRDARSEARVALVAILKELGPAHMRAVVTTIRETLVDGYQLHVRGHTLHAILEGTVDLHAASLRAKRQELGQMVPARTEEERDSIDDIPAAEVLSMEVCTGSVDEVISEYMDVIQDELFGRLAEQKDKDSTYHSRVAALLESRSSRAFEMLELLGRSVAFLPAPSIHQILGPLLEKVNTTNDIKQLRTTEEGLRRIGFGITSNPDCRVPHLMVYIHHILSLEYNVEDAQAEDAGAKISKRPKREGRFLGEIVDGMQTELDQPRAKSGNLSNWVVSESATEREKAARRVRVRNAYEGIHLVEDTPQMTGRDRFENKRKRNSKGYKESIKAANRHIVVEHVLGLLYSAIKNKRLKPSIPQHKELVEPMVPLLGVVFRESKASLTAVLALRILSQLIEWNLSSARSEFPRLVTSILELLQRIGHTGSSNTGARTSIGTSQTVLSADTTQESIKTLTAILTRCDFISPTKDHLTLLAVLAQNNVNVVTRQQSTLALLRAIVKRKFVTVEVYDLMNTLSEMVFSAESKTVRTTASSILISFFINYPLSEKRLRQHLNLLIANLDFSVEEGRLAALHMMAAIIKKFPSEVLHEIAQLCFFPLLLRLVNDNSSECRSQVCVVLCAVFSRLEASKANELVGMTQGWFAKGETQPLLERAAIQVVGLVSEAKEGSLVSTSTALDFVAKLELVLKRAVVDSEEPQAWERVFLKAEDQGEGEGWLTTFHALTALFKVGKYVKGLRGCTDLLLKPRANGGPESSIFSSIILPLAQFHPHMWVRLTCLRLIGEVINGVDPKAIASPSRKGYALSTLEDIKRMSGVHGRLLNFDSLDDKIGDQLAKNLVWICTALLALEGDDFEETKTEDTNKEASEDDSDGGEEDGEAEDQPNISGKQHSGFNWLMHRLSFSARFKGPKRDTFEKADRRQVIVFKVFAFLATQWADTPEQLARRLPQMLSPLARASESGVTEKENKFSRRQGLLAPSLAKECIDLIEQLVGTNKFVAAYSKVQRAIEIKRDTRKRERAIERVTDPAMATLKRQKRYASKKLGRKHRNKEKMRLLGE